MTGTLDKKVAIVTGGAGGIGTATAKKMAEAGAMVAVVDLFGEAAEKVAEDIRGVGGTAAAFSADVSDEDQVRRLVEEVQNQFGGVDVLFNNAGIMRRSTLFELDVDTWDLVMAVNVRSIFLMCKYVVPIMEAAGGGSIINTGSGWGLKGGDRALSYCASKGAVVNMTRALAIDHGAQGIRVNSVNPGDVDTGMLRDEAHQLGQDETSFLVDAGDRPLGRTGQPSEIADVVVWLASEQSSYVTGAAIVADGGGTA